MLPGGAAPADAEVIDLGPTKAPAGTRIAAMLAGRLPGHGIPY